MLTQFQETVYKLVVENGEPIAVAELAEKMNVSLARVRNALYRLHQAGKVYIAYVRQVDGSRPCHFYDAMERKPENLQVLTTPQTYHLTKKSRNRNKWPLERNIILRNAHRVAQLLVGEGEGKTHGLSTTEIKTLAKVGSGVFAALDALIEKDVVDYNDVYDAELGYYVRRYWWTGVPVPAFFAD